MKQTHAERLLQRKGYRQSPLGRMAARKASRQLSAKRRQIAQAKSGKIITTKPGVFDGSAVQQTLNVWSGL